jgi:hypothetical protein
MGGTSWVLGTALDAVSSVVVAGFVITVGGDVAAERRGLGLVWRGCGGCGGCRGAVC